MTDNSRNDRRRNFDGRIDTLGTGTNGVSRRVADRISAHRQTEEEATSEAPLADEEAPERDTSDEDEGEETEADDDDTEADDSPRSDGVTPEADVSFDEDEETDEAEADDSASPHETRTENVDERASLEIELDPFVRAFAARRADKGEESLDEYIVGSVKGYLAGLLGGDVSSPGTLEREVEVNADPIFEGLLESIGGDDQTTDEVVIDAVAEAYDVPIDEDTLVVAGLRDHEALLNGVVANGSNDLDDISEVVQAAVETRLIEEPA